jgi:succinoglycan biosynthesis protein ExoA
VRNQDDEFNYRLLERGGRILLSPKIKSRYYNRTTVRSLWSQYFKYGYWKVRVMQKHPRQMRPRQFVPIAFVVALLVSVFAALFSIAGKWGLIFLMALYLMTNLGATTVACVRKSEWSLLPLVPVAFAVIHFSYGLGFLIGLISFWNRWGDSGERLGSGNFPLESGKQF